MPCPSAPAALSLSRPRPLRCAQQSTVGSDQELHHSTVDSKQNLAQSRGLCFRMCSVPGVSRARNTTGGCRMACSMPRFLWSFEEWVPCSTVDMMPSWSGSGRAQTSVSRGYCGYNVKARCL